MSVRPVLSPYWGEPDEKIWEFVAAQAKALQDADVRDGSIPVEAAYIARGLASWDAQLRGHTSPETDDAIRFAFKMQANDGNIRAKDRWPPINSTTYHGTAMLAMAVADAPGWLNTVNDNSVLTQLDRLKAFFRHTPTKNGHEQLLLLWVSTYFPDLIPQEQQVALIDEVWKQQQEDGGWSIWTFGSPETLGGGKKAETIRNEPDFKNPTSDGYQTGLAVVVLRNAGVPANDPRIKQAVEWLRRNQRKSGRWWTRSLNTQSRFNFISYSGTAYAALALAKCDALPVVEE